ncbi:hypothetical protein C8R45DRAFT_935503 [Mycena sanguinolenta]|nr:hypothetical protein C8R45DRAFT_935503 [Mycena sanguinolenta]
MREATTNGTGATLRLRQIDPLDSPPVHRTVLPPGFKRLIVLPELNSLRDPAKRAGTLPPVPSSRSRSVPLAHNIRERTEGNEEGKRARGVRAHGEATNTNTRSRRSGSRTVKSTIRAVAFALARRVFCAGDNVERSAHAREGYGEGYDWTSYVSRSLGGLGTLRSGAKRNENRPRREKLQEGETNGYQWMRPRERGGLADAQRAIRTTKDIQRTGCRKNTEDEGSTTPEMEAAHTAAPAVSANRVDSLSREALSTLKAEESSGLK